MLQFKFFCHGKSVMKWKEEKDVILLTTMAGEGVFEWKHGSRERGSAWDLKAGSLH